MWSVAGTMIKGTLDLKSIFRKTGFYKYCTERVMKSCSDAMSGIWSIEFSLLYATSLLLKGSTSRQVAQ